MPINSLGVVCIPSTELVLYRCLPETMDVCQQWYLDDDVFITMQILGFAVGKG